MRERASRRARLALAALAIAAIGLMADATRARGDIVAESERGSTVAEVDASTGFVIDRLPRVAEVERALAGRNAQVEALRERLAASEVALARARDELAIALATVAPRGCYEDEAVVTVELVVAVDPTGELGPGLEWVSPSDPTASESPSIACVPVDDLRP
jgi:hypothetical protein